MRSEKRSFKGSPSATFHGRDIFAYVAGLIASGRRPEEVGPKVSKLEKLDLSQPKLSGKNLSCQVLYIDGFGNAICNVGEEIAVRLPVRPGESVGIRFGARVLKAIFVESYYEVDKGAMEVLLGSQGFLEIAVRE